LPDSVLAMTSTSSNTPARHPVVGFLVLVAGVAWLLEIIVPKLLFVSGTAWLAVIVAAALTVGFLFLGFGHARLIPRIAFLVAAIGWLIFLLNDLQILGQWHFWGALIALVGTLLSGIFVLMHHKFGRIAEVLFLLASIAISIALLEELIKPFLTGTAATILDYAEAILLVLAGIFVMARR
jgi:hypothetical protein